MRCSRILLLASLILAVSCSRKTENSQRSEAALPDAGAAVEQRGDRAPGKVSSKQEIILTQSVPRPDSQAQAPILKQSEEQRLLVLEARPRMPADFKIGPLADVLENDKGEREVIATARRFLDSLREGSTAAETLENGIREQLKSSLDYYLSEGFVPLDYRLGTLTFAEEQDKEGTAWLNVRLFGSPGVSEGELYLERSESGRWYVSDLQISLERLGQPYSQTEEKYFPSTYGWRIQ